MACAPLLSLNNNHHHDQNDYDDYNDVAVFWPKPRQEIFAETMGQSICVIKVAQLQCQVQTILAKMPEDSLGIY